MNTEIKHLDGSNPFEKIQKIILKYFRWVDEPEVLKIKESDVISDKLNELGFDSLDEIELVFRIEKEFNISIPEEMMGKIYSKNFTFNDIITYYKL